MKNLSSRRSFLKKSAAATLTAPLALSLEEHTLLAQQGGTARSTPPKAAVPTGRIGNLAVSRLICGGNLINGYAHSRDLIYVSALLKQYFTDEKILDTWAECEAHGINTMILYPADKRAVALYQKHCKRGGKIQYLAQISPSKEDLTTAVKQAKDAGAAGAFLLGNYTDAWTREGATPLVGELLARIKEMGLVSGVAAHELRSVKAIEEAGFAPDFYMKTLHDTNYWSSRKPDQMKEVIDNYGVDNYWCMDPKATITYMADLSRPWIAYKVLAAGAIHPRSGFKHAFANGADFVAVGMFDFQIAENAAIASASVEEAKYRDREWLA